MKSKSYISSFWPFRLELCVHRNALIFKCFQNYCYVFMSGTTSSLLATHIMLTLHIHSAADAKFSLNVSEAAYIKRTHQKRFIFKSVKIIDVPIIYCHHNNSLVKPFFWSIFSYNATPCTVLLSQVAIMKKWHHSDFTLEAI